MQTVTGRWPQKTTSSEFAALFDLVILPKLRSFYLRKKADGSVDYEDYAERCRKFAVDELKLPPRLWSKVHLPAYISLDNATIHDWALKLSFRPRQKEERLRAELGPRWERDFGLPAFMAEQFAVFAAQPGPQRQGKDAVQGVGSMLGNVPPQNAEASARMSAATMRWHIDKHDRAHNCSWVQDQLHDQRGLARHDVPCSTANNAACPCHPGYSLPD